MELVACLVIMLVFGTPGVRLLGLWRRTGERPEGLLAIFFLGFALGIPASLYSITHRDASYVYGLRL